MNTMADSDKAEAKTGKRPHDETEGDASNEQSRDTVVQEPPIKVTKTDMSQDLADRNNNEGQEPGGKPEAAKDIDSGHLEEEDKKAESGIPAEKAKPSQEAPSSENIKNDHKQDQADKTSPKAAPTLPSGLPPGLPGTGLPGTVHPTLASEASVANSHGDNPEAIVEEKGEVSSLYVGRVIGKGGEMIRDLQARSGARIDVDQNVPPGMPRVITYRGNRKTVDFAKRLVYMLCQENVNEADLPLGEATREYLVVPATSVGKIIGRGGEMIRELQARSHAKIQVDHSGTSGLDASEKQVTITGSEQSVVKGKEMVLFLVANPNMDAMQSLNMLVEDKVQRGGVWGSGPPYPNLPQNGQNMQPSSGSYGYDPSYYGGASSAPGGSYVAASTTPYGAPAIPGGAAYGMPNSMPYQQPPPVSFGGGMETEVFPAAKSFMGRIIGSKGVTINDLQRRSACDIQINQDVPPGRDCEITIRGTRQGIEMVKQMLREIIEIGPSHPYAGGGGGQSHGAYQQSGHALPTQGYGAYQAQGYVGGRYDQHQAYGQPAYGPQSGYSGGSQYQQGGQYATAHATLEWKTATAPDGQVYYYNERSGETTWQKPPGMP